MENVAQKPGDFLFFLLLFGWVFFFFEAVLKRRC